MVEEYTKVDNTTSDSSGKDITDQVEVDDSKVKIYSIEELAPSSTPMTIPYLEIYRTNELEYIPYISPFNVGASASSSDSDTNSDSSDTNSDTNSDSSDTNSDTNSDSSDTNSDTSSNS